MTPANKRGNMFNPKLIPTYIACSTVKSNDLAKSESLQNIANPPPSRDPLFEIDPESSLPTLGDSGPAAFATHNIRSESLPPTRPVTPDPESREPEFRSLETLLRVQEPSFGGAIETEAEPTVQDRLKQDNEPSPDALSNAPHPALLMNAIAIEPSANLGVFERSTCPSPSRSTTQNISSSGSAPQARESAPGTSSEAGRKRNISQRDEEAEDNPPIKRRKTQNSKHPPFFEGPKANMKSRKGKEYCRSRSSSPETLAFKTPSEKASQVSTPKRKRCRDSQDDEVDDRRESKRAKTIERSVASSSRFPPTRLPPPPSPTWSESAFPRVYNPVSVDLAYQGMQPPSRRHEGLTPFQLEAARHGWQGMVSSSRSVPPAANVRYPAPHANFTLPSPSSPSSKSLSNGRTESTTAKDPLEVPQPETGSFPLPLNSRQRRREPSATTRDQNPASRVQTRTARGASTHIAPPTKGVSPRKLSDGEGWAEVFELDRGPVLDSSGKRKREDSDDLDFSSKKTKPTNARKRGRESDYSDEPLVPKKTNKAKTKNTSRSLLSLLSSHHSTPETVGHARANRSGKKPTKPTRNSNPPGLQKCKKASKGKHMCPECDKTYSRKSDVARHSEVIHQGKVKVCLECGAELSRSDSLRRHKLTCPASLSPTHGGPSKPLPRKGGRDEVEKEDGDYTDSDGFDSDFGL